MLNCLLDLYPCHTVFKNERMEILISDSTFELSTFWKLICLKSDEKGTERWK